MQYQDASASLVAVWAVALLISGTGIGMAWPHLSAWAMSRVDDPGEGPAAAAAVNPMQLTCGASGAGLAGVVVNATGTAQARWLFAVMAVLAVVCTLGSTRSARR